MTDENTRRLYERFSRWIKPDPTLRGNLMAFGCECGDGWYGILERLLVDIAAMSPPADFAILQVKEKYGTLRVYVSSASDAIFDRIDQAELESAATCEICGKPGKLRGTHWVETLCDDCAKEAPHDPR